MTRDQFIYALTACGCLLKDGKTWYEHNELIKCFEDLGLFEQEPILNKIRAEIKDYFSITCDGNCDNCNRVVKNPCGESVDGAWVLHIIDKYKAENNS